mgnify:FL=1
MSETATRRGKRRGGRNTALARDAQPAQDLRRTQNLRLPVIGQDKAMAIHNGALRILEEVGVKIDDEATRKDLLENHGCCADEDGYIQIPAERVSDALSTIPDRVLLHNRDGKQVVDTRSDTAAYCAGHNCVNVLDHRTGELRPGVLQDLANTAKVCEALPHLDVACTLGYPTDVPAEEEARSSVNAMMDNTIKPIAFTAHDEIKAQAIWQSMAERVGGWQALGDTPCGLDLTGPVSPLKLGDELCRRLQLGARNNLPVVCYPAIFPGMAGPITMAGVLAQSAAETLAGVVIHQIAAPGAPVLAGSSVLPMDMKTATIAYGGPEYMLGNLGGTDYYNAIGLPTWVGAGCSDAHAVDAQAASEVGANLVLANLAGTSFIHNLGFLSSGRTGSLEMLVLCDELAGWASRFAHGIEVTEETIGVEVVKRAAKDNTYLTDDHTTERYLTESWFPPMFERSDAMMWRDDGAVTMQDKIKARLAEILDI